MKYLAVSLEEGGEWDATVQAARPASEALALRHARAMKAVLLAAKAWAKRWPRDRTLDEHALVTDPPYSSGGFTRGDRMADPSAKYRASGAAEIISFAGCELSEHYHALASRRLHAEAAGADGTAAALGGQLALGGAP